MLVDFLLLFPNLGGVSLENLAKYTVRLSIVKQLSLFGSDGEYDEDDKSSGANVDSMGQTVIRKKKKIHYKDNAAGELYRKFNDLNEQNRGQLTILHNDFEELYVNTKNVISSDGIAIKDFMRINATNQILLFQFYSNITNKAIEKILLYDFQQLANYNEMQRRIDDKITVFIIDEASEVFQDQGQVSGMVQQFRSKRIALGFGIQEKAGLEKADKRGLLNTIINNCTTFFISRLRDEETIRAVAAIHGTTKHLMHTDQTISDEKGNISHSGAGSLRVDETFI
jgi:hypothetical protein